MEPFSRLTSRCVFLLRDDVDTDQIIPARFLKVTTREGLGKALFADWRYDADGRPRPEFVLNTKESEGARVLVAGRNFGSGSSREHAVWALAGHGFRAVVALSFADIFRGNAFNNGFLPVALDAEAHARLVARPEGEVTIDLGEQAVRLPDGTSARFAVDSFARHRLLSGLDTLDFLLTQEPLIAQFESARRSESTEPRRFTP